MSIMRRKEFVISDYSCYCGEVEELKKEGGQQ